MTSRLIYGFHAVTSKLRHDPGAIKEIMIDAGRQDARARDLLKHAELQGIRVIATDNKRLDGMAPDGKHQGVVARIEGGRKVAHLDDVLDTLDEPAFLLVLDGITDPRNLGACLRVRCANCRNVTSRSSARQGKRRATCTRLSGPRPRPGSCGPKGRACGA